MTSWDDQFQDLKTQFIARSKDRMNAIESLLARLMQNPSDISILRQVMQHFHWLAGSGGTYGFNDITQWGTYGEELCDYLLKLQSPVTPADHDKLTTALNTVEQLFAAQVAQPTHSMTGEVQTKMKGTSELLIPPGALMNTIQEAGNRPGSAGAFNQLSSMGTGANSYGNKTDPGAGNKPTGGYTTDPGYTSGSSNPNYSEAGTTSSQAPGYANTNPGYQPADTGYNSPAKNTSEYNTSSQQKQTSSYSKTSDPYASGTSNPGYASSPNYNQGPSTVPTSSGQNNPNSASGQAPSSSQGGIFPSAAGQKDTGAFPINQTIDSYSRNTAQNQLPPKSSGSYDTPTRIMDGSGIAPPLSTSSMPQDSTAMLSGTRPGTSEMRKPSRLAHIPANRKFAIFVDSNLANLAPLKQTVEERGLMVEGFSSASEVKTALAERLPDLLIIGAPLIDNNGYDLVEHIRSLEAGNKPIVLLLAQQAVFLDKVQAIRAGADAFFEYPAELSDLIDKIHTLLERDKNESYKILSVEDDPDQANFIKLTLQSAGYNVLHISDPKQFEEHFLSFEPDLVMLDVLLGDLTGFELAKYIRQNDRFATLPIVFLTTQNKLHQHIRSAFAGGDEHLIKPVPPQLLIATVASRLERARALKRLIDRDGLTRCLNYGSFMERSQKLATPEGYRAAPAMMMIDIDNMKRINEKLGFAAGDRIISNIANMLLKGFRNTDLIARFSNDEFAIVLEHLNVQQLQSLSSQVLGAISGTPQLVRGRSVSVTCSGGVAVLEQGMSIQEWLSSAQDALKKAKDAGGNRAIVKAASR